MRIGLLSDSHGHAKRLRRAIELLTGRGAETLVHSGDLCELEHVDLLGAAGVPSHLVAGNIDRAILPLLPDRAARCGVDFAPDFLAVALGDGRRLAATHGHLEDLLEELIGGGQFPYVCHGHTHRRRDQRVGGCRVLNPGALHHPRDPVPTVLLLNTTLDQAEFIPLT
jgi:putative phosphoesterase